MNQGRKQNQIEASNKMMVTFLLAMVAFVLVTFTFNLIESKSDWIKKLEQQFASKTH